jgi:hypothetical protein
VHIQAGAGEIIMQRDTDSQSLQLSAGGLIHSLMIRLHLQAPGDYRIRRRILLLVTLAWLPMLLLTLAEGNLFNRELDISFITDPVPYVRFFITLPLLIAAGVLIDPLIGAVISSMNTSGILSRARQGDYDSALDVLARRIDSRTADVAILAVVYLLAIIMLSTSVGKTDVATMKSWITGISDDPSHLSYAGLWFYLVSSPILLVLLFRWLWRIANWCEFVFRISRIELELEPTHPDHAGGLGFLRNSQNAFLVIFFAFATMLSATIAQEMLFDGATMTIALPVIAIYVIISLVISTLPLVFFSRQLMWAKRRGRITYGALGYQLSRAFDEKWAKPEKSQARGTLLETADASAVCDYSTVYDVVRNMHFVPVSVREYVLHAVILSLPFVPLVFIEMPFAEVIRRLLDTLI